MANSIFIFKNIFPDFPIFRQVTPPVKEEGMVGVDREIFACGARWSLLGTRTPFEAAANPNGDPFQSANLLRLVLAHPQ